MNNQQEITKSGEAGMQLYKQPTAVSISDHASIDDLQDQVQTIQHAMKAVMRQDEHFGTIPGTNKPTLLKPGAEKLSLLFRLAPEYQVHRFESGGGHREYEVKCRLTHINSGNFIGAGVGSCSTMEKKYRWRSDDTPTGVAVPKTYWNGRDVNLLVRALESAGVEIPDGADIGTTKQSGSWQISFRSKVENPDLADTYNTVLKMAKKRAHVDAILTATAASDIFTQDVEDMPQFAGKEESASGKGKQSNGNGQQRRKKKADEDKEWLNEGTKHWENAEEKIRSGEFTASQLRDYYKVSNMNMEYFEKIESKRRAEIDNEFDNAEDLEGTPF